MKGSRTKLKDKAKVIVEKIKNTDLRLRELEEITWLDHSTVWRILQKELPEVAKSSDIIKNIIENDLETVSNMAEIAKKYTGSLKVKQYIEESDIKTANTITDSSFKRHQLLSWWATERIENKITLEEEELLKQAINENI